ncbi:MAG: outer membrane protein assembly factor BamB family protein, partial [Planctomycetota bacterium]
RFNMPQTASNMCADDDYVYLAVKNSCWRLDGETGARALTYRLDETARDWGCVFRHNDKLVGSAQVEGASYTAWWGTRGWYNDSGPEQQSKVCSKYIFANDAQTGARIWSYPADRNGAIINSAVAIANDRVYLVESRNTVAKNHASGRFYMNELWRNQYLVALDINSGNPNGTVLWEEPIDTVDGTSIFYLYYADERLIIQTSNGNHHLYAYNAADGEPIWNKAIASPTTGHSPAIKRGAIVGETIFCQPKGYSIVNGAEVVSSGVAAAECGIFSASRDYLLYRPHGNMTMWNVNTRMASDWSQIRPGCWLNIIPSGGMVLAPEGGGGCDCYGWFHTSVGFVRSEE